MTPQRPRSSLFYYVPVLIAAMGIVVFVFLRNYQKGALVGQHTPPREDRRSEAGATVDEQALARNTGLAAEGKTLFQLNCASCHGDDGTGNGPRATGLNPPPRNFKAQEFKFGNDIVAIHSTILKGSPGTSMPSFALLTPQETWAMAHYVLSMVPNAPPITDELVAALPGGGAGAAGQTGVTQGAGSVATPQTTAASGPDKEGSTAAPSSGGEPQGQRIPILVAMERLAQEAAPVGRIATINTSHPGAVIYAQHCARCHGAQAEGQFTRPISVAPLRYQNTVSLVNLKSPWLADRNKFGELVVKGLPGRSMPGQATLTRPQIDALYTFLRTLSPQ